MNSNSDRLSLVVDGKAVVHPCVELLALSITPKAEGAAGYVRFHEAFEHRYGQYVQHIRLNDSTKWRRLQVKDHGKLRAWFSDERSLDAAMLGLTEHTNDVPEDPRPPLFEFFFFQPRSAPPRGMFRIVLPFATGDSAAALLELIDDAMADFPVHWGTAGYAFYWKGTDTATEKHAEQWLGRHLVRHPGLGTGDYMTWGSFVRYGVSSLGWLTFLGDSLVAELGGREGLGLAVRDAGVQLRNYARGVALQAGLSPQLGDVNRGDLLPLYREIGRIIEPVFARDEVLEKIHVVGIEDPDDELAWLRRFLP